MRIRATAAVVAFAGFLTSAPANTQDLGPQIQKFGDGIYAYIGKDFKSNTGIILTQDGVVLIDSGHEPTDSRAVMEAVKKLTPMPVRLPHRYGTASRSYDRSFCLLSDRDHHRRGRSRRVDAQPRTPSLQTGSQGSPPPPRP